MCGWCVGGGDVMIDVFLCVYDVCGSENDEV